MKDDGDVGASGLQDLQNARKSVRKTTRGPGEGGVLDENPAPAPGRRLEAQSAKSIAPAENFPGNATNFHFQIMGAQRSAQVAAILLDGVRGHVLASEKSDDGRSHFGSAST